MNTRTDIHRPSAINPADYVCVGFKYIGPYQLAPSADDRRQIEAHREKTGGRYSSHEHGGTCSICGAHALTLGVFYHAATNTYINAGEDCAAKLDLGDAVEFRSFKKRLAAGLEAARGKAKAQKTLAELGLTDAWAVYEGSASAWEENTIRDIVSKLVQYGSISEKQAAFLGKLLAQIPAREAQKAERAAVNANSKHVGTVGARATWHVRVEWVKSFDSQFGTTFIHGLRDADGNVVIYKGSRQLADKGQHVGFVATIKEHGERDGVKQTVVARPASITIEELPVAA